jgi:hypothetical protein
MRSESGLCHLLLLYTYRVFTWINKILFERHNVHKIYGNQQCSIKLVCKGTFGTDSELLAFDELGHS